MSEIVYTSVGSFVCGISCVTHWRNLSNERKLELLRYLKEAHQTNHDNFRSRLLRLMHKADCANTLRFSEAWPDEMSVVYVWKGGLVNEDYSLSEKGEKDKDA